MSENLDEAVLLRSTKDALLPAGVSEQAWEEERARVQNPRIRAFLKCIDTLEPVRESNYALLHCSPGRIEEILGIVRNLSRMIAEDVAPLVRMPSVVPELESARESIELYFSTIEKDVLVPIERLSGKPGQQQIGDVRRFLCIAIGKLHAFLVDSQSQFLAADPRSQHDADYFLSRRFPRDVEEAEWLHASVLRLSALLEELEKGREAALVARSTRVQTGGTTPDRADWARTAAYLGAIRDALLPLLREILTLKGIRMSEIELIEGHSASLLPECALAFELSELGGLIASESSDERAASIVADRLDKVLGSISFRIRDLVSFLPLWERGVSHRRALILKKQLAAGGHLRPVEAGAEAPKR